MSTALNNAGHNCNLVTQAESLVMAKERIVEQYGEIRYTIGTGCSGGSLTQQQVANAYPGIYQGILPQCSFPDAWSTGQQLVDYHLLRLYLENPAQVGARRRLDAGRDRRGRGPSQPRQLDRPRHALLDRARRPDRRAAPASAPRSATTPQTNPGGVRCTLADYMINVLGPRDRERLGPAGAAARPRLRRPPARQRRRPVRARRRCRAARITPEQFVDLNAKVGGGTIDIQPTAERFAADQPALRNVYRSGGVNTANNLDQVAIIDLRGPDPGAFHDAYRTWAIRARLEREHGTFANHVIWFGQVPLIGDPNYTDGRPGRDGPLARRGRGRQDEAAAGREDRPRPPGGHPGPLLADPGRRARSRCRASARSASSTRPRPATARRARSPASRSRPTRTSAR